MSVAAIYLAGGVGSRAQQGKAKQLAMLHDKPLFLHALSEIDQVEQIEYVAIPCASEALEETQLLLSEFGFSSSKYELIPGGATRQESVYLGLRHLAARNPKPRQVIIHEAARPFVTPEDFKDLIECASENAILGAPIPFTVLKQDRMSGIVAKTLDRNELINVQLPQIFDFEALINAHESARKAERSYTEDASLLFEELGAPVKVLPGNELNIKITYPSDYTLAEDYYEAFLQRLAEE